MKVLLLDNIRSLQNVGAILRNCDGSGFKKVFFTGCTPHPPRNEIAKTALGAEKTIDWEYFSDSVSLVKDIKKQGYKIFSVELDKNSIPYTKLFGNTPENICLVLGNEVKGVAQNVLDISDEIVMIPMLGKKESLNVSVAAGIVMYATL